MADAAIAKNSERLINIGSGVGIYIAELSALADTNTLVTPFSTIYFCAVTGKDGSLVADAAYAVASISTGTITFQMVDGTGGPHDYQVLVIGAE